MFGPVSVAIWRLDQYTIVNLGELEHIWAKPKMAEDYNEFGRNQVGSNPPDEPHISGGVWGPSGAKLGHLGGAPMVKHGSKI